MEIEVLKNVVDEIKRLAKNRDWIFLCHQEKNHMISFEKEFDYSSKPVRINVYYKKDSSKRNLNLTIATAMDHPKKGKTQLYRRGVNNSKFIKLLKNPRQHTGRGYYRK